MKKFFLALSLVGGLLLVQSAFAVGPLDKATLNLGSALGGTGLEPDISVSIGTVVKGLLSVVGTLFLLLTVYAGILWMTAQGSEDKVTKAKDIIQAAVIGLFVVMSAYAITAFVTSKVSSGGSSSSTRTTCEAQANARCVQVQTDCVAPATAANVGGDCVFCCK